MKIVALIPARYAASRFPAKLMQDLGGEPVIVRTYQACVETGLFDAVEVVTDSPIISEAVAGRGGRVSQSQRQHQSGSDRIAERLETMDADIVVNVQGDEPFVNAEALGQLVRIFREDTEQDVDVVSLMQVLEEEEKIKDPNYVKVVVDAQGCALYFSRSPIPFVRDKDEAGAKASYYEHIGVYGFRRQALLDFAKASPTPLEQWEKVECLRFLEQGKKIKMIRTKYIGVEIDTPQDLALANTLFNKKSL